MYVYMYIDTHIGTHTNTYTHSYIYNQYNIKSVYKDNASFKSTLADL